MSSYTLDKKIRALNWLRDGQSYEHVSARTDIPVSTLQRWHSQRDKLREEYKQQLRDEAAYTMALVHNRMADKAVELVNALDADRIEKAPLNQVASALGVLIDRFLKLEEAQKESQASEEQVIRIEYYDASTGKVSQTPPWSESDSESSGTLQGRGLRATLRQDDDRPNYRNGKGVAWDADMVARSDLSDGESGLAGFEDDDDGRDWYHD
jgi:hypothetical protein